MSSIVLGLGSNRKFNDRTPVEVLSLACTSLKSFVKDMKVSSVYRTGAMYYRDQDDFYNMVAAGTFEGTPQELLRKINEVEAEFGRDRQNEFRNGPRSLDIDIELFGSEVIREENLIVPHERLLERAFVLYPLVELFESMQVEKDDFLIYSSSLADVQDQKIDLYMKSGDFLKLMEKSL